MSVNILYGQGAKPSATWLAAVALWIGTLSVIPLAPSLFAGDSLAALPPAHEVHGSTPPCVQGSARLCTPSPSTDEVSTDDQQRPFDCACIEPVRKVAGVDNETDQG